MNDDFYNEINDLMLHFEKKLNQVTKAQKCGYKVDKQLIKDAQKMVDSQLLEISRSCLLTAEIIKISAKMKLRYSFKSLEFTSAILKEIYKDKSFQYG